LDFVPAVVSYDQLLQAFWSGHDPAYAEPSRQYRSVIFYLSEEQKNLAIASREREESAAGQPLFTQIEALGEFYLAEDYHQKYYLRGNPEINAEISAIYTGLMDFVNSTASTRLNGYIAGYGNQDILQKQLDSLGLSEDGKKRLLKLTSSGLKPGCPLNRCNQ
jgi:peptide-methionine (S)-S-oxide reductase